MLKLGPVEGETTVSLVQRIQDAATEAHVLPKAG
jgi:hypothetical protein